MNNISFDLYNLFYVVANIGNISKASEILYISQPAVTQSIHKLEEQLGGTLFYRVPTGVVLTEEGKKLYDYIKESVEIMENAEKKFSQYISLDEGMVRIRCGNTFGNLILYKSLLNFSKMFPNINIEISSGLTSESISGLSKGKCDMVILKLPCYNIPNNVEVISGPGDELVLYASTEYLKEHPVKDYKDLEGCNMILTGKNSNTGKIFLEFLNENNIKMSARYEISSSDARKYFAIHGLGIAIGQKSLIQKELDEGILHTLELEPALPKMQIGIAILKGDISSFATLKLLDFIKDEINK